MKKVTLFLSLATTAIILSGCYVSPYAYQNGPYRAGYQCPPPIKVEVDMKKKKRCKPVCKPACEQPACQPVYKPTCAY
jgi:hypothetical protein